MRTINNQDRIAQQVNDLNLVGVSAVGDDGNVCIQVVGDRIHTINVAQTIMLQIGDPDTGDGVQTGSMFINNDAIDIHDDMYVVANLD